MHRHRQHLRPQGRQHGADLLACACSSCCYEAGLPKGVVNLVTCSRNEAELLLTHPLVRGVTFVGSTDVGQHVYSVAAAHGKRVQAQTEAKNHGLVLDDASLERAAAGIINSTFGCAGMRCMALPVCVVENAWPTSSSAT